MVRILAAMFNDMEERHVTTIGQVSCVAFFPWGVLTARELLKPVL